MRPLLLIEPLPSVVKTVDEGKQRHKKVGLILRQNPYDNSLAHEALDAVLAMSVHGQAITVVFMGDGVFQLLKGQNNQSIQQKSIEKKLAAFEMYDINTIFVCNFSLKQRQLTPESLSVDTRILDQQDLIQLLHNQDTLLSF